MQYFYAILWFAIGLILIFSISKENKIFYLAGGVFLIMGGWWLADALLPAVNLFEGGWGIALKAITGVALLVLVIAFFREYRKKTKEAREQEEAKKSGEE